MPTYDITTRQRIQKTPRFADPWGFHRTHRPPEPIAGHDGRRVEMAVFSRGRVLAFRAAGSEESETPSEPILLPSLLRRVSAVVARYRNEAWCTDAQLRTIESLWVEGLSLRELARREGVAPAAIEARINGLHTKAPEFYRWWRLKHRTRRRR